MIRNFLTAILAIAIIVGCSTCDSTKPDEPIQALPHIKTFTAWPSEILILDSTAIVWNVQNADSLRILPLDTVIKPVDSGQFYFFPDSTITLTGIAYSVNGRDSVESVATVTIVPFRLRPKFNPYIKGNFGSSAFDPAMTLILSDSAGRTLSDTTIFFSIVDGDGLLGFASGITDGNGEVSIDYTWGSDPTVTLRARYADQDSTDLFLRADILSFSGAKQVQYVLLSDTYGDVLNYLGDPLMIDPPPIPGTDGYVVANYEETLGAVFVISDYDYDGIIQDSSAVIGAVVVDSVFAQQSGGVSHRYEGTDENGIGIGSSYPLDIKTIFGNPNKIELNTDDPLMPAIIVTYDSLNTQFWLFDNVDSVVFQIIVQD